MVLLSSFILYVGLISFLLYFVRSRGGSSVYYGFYSTGSDHFERISAIQIFKYFKFKKKKIPPFLLIFQFLKVVEPILFLYII